MYRHTSAVRLYILYMYMYVHTTKTWWGQTSQWCLDSCLGLCSHQQRICMTCLAQHPIYVHKVHSTCIFVWAQCLTQMHIHVCCFHTRFTDVWYCYGTSHPLPGTTHTASLLTPALPLPPTHSPLHTRHTLAHARTGHHHSTRHSRAVSVTKRHHQKKS